MPPKDEIAERKVVSDLRLVSPVTGLAVDGQRLLEVADGVLCALLAEHHAEIGQHPGLTRPVSQLSRAGQGKTVRRQPFRAVPEPVEAHLHGRRKLPCDVMQTVGRGLAGPGDPLGARPPPPAGPPPSRGEGPRLAPRPPRGPAAPAPVPLGPAPPRRPRR